jgi:hypothetical protein
MIRCNCVLVGFRSGAPSGNQLSACRFPLGEHGVPVPPMISFLVCNNPFGVANLSQLLTDTSVELYVWIPLILCNP